MRIHDLISKLETESCNYSLSLNSSGKSYNPGTLQHSVTFIREIRAKFGIPNFPQSPDTGQNSDGSISDFRFSAQ